MRSLNSFWQRVVNVTSVLLVLFHVYTTAFGAFTALVQRSVHLGVVLALCFIIKPISKKHAGENAPPAFDIFFALFSLAAAAFVSINSVEIAWTPLAWYGPFDVIFAVGTVLLIMEAARRTIGWTFPIMAVVLLIYSVFGTSFPGIWGHKNFGLSLIFQTYYHTSNGIWGTMVGISATTLAMFGIFGAILGQTGGSETFVKIGKKLTGRFTGGTAKMSLISDALFGMISGSAMANVVGTGVFTIPMMKKSGFPAKWAAAFEAVGSTGGQIMPPIMGSAAFIMAQLIATPYVDIARAAIIPALLYYIAAFVTIHGIGRRYNVLGTAEKVSITATEYVNIFLPIGVFLVWLIRGYSATSAALYASITALLICTFTNFFAEKNAKAAVSKLKGMAHQSAIKGAGSIIDMAVLLAGAQLSITLISMTGLGVKLANIIVSIGENNLFLCLLLSMFVCIILGMGLPTTAAYVLGAAVLAPALTGLGLSAFVAHMFIFFFSCLATITPPVCAAVFLAAGLAETGWLAVGVASVMTALPAFVVPYTFAYNPALLLMGDMAAIMTSVSSAMIGVIFMGIAVAGYWKSKFRMVFRFTLIASGILMVIPSNLTSIIGLVIGVVSILLNKMTNKHIRTV